ncbi:metallophosphoesterase [Lactobacillus sp. ESL0731]|uniref:metallophosphoesterase family protein n=1 Tax=unclassified Lactobacillus TaxID=2620435 RepID=UPI0023F77FCD|nr:MULTISPECIES: metallophosphoesterase [unclassified Lactobacillus]WEV50278.1 metallophosphoesterase [Lactobacillus sp. ESL0700]WEV61407.1 metallophosphoesterase [Lactobacillus sp. ESL0731]
MITDKLNSEFWVITDTHLIADSLHDDGSAFARMQNTSQGKDLVYQEVALSAFCKMAQEKKPAAIIVTGDVTFNGELISAQKFQEIFSSLTETKLLVLPGNHDIYDGWARSFKAAKQSLTPQISPQAWRQVFKSTYDCSLSQDPHSLAYSVQLNPQYLLLMLDSNIYDTQENFSSPNTEGQISDDQFVWLEKQLIAARQHHLRPLLFMHHTLYVHNPEVNRGFVLNNAPLLRQLCQEYDVKMAFSGHIHAQNIVDPVGKTPTTEIVTSSFCSYDQAYGVVKVSPEQVTYQRETFDMVPYLTDLERQNHRLTHFHQYLKDIQLRNLSSQSETTNPLLDEQSPLIKEANDLFLSMNFNYFTGHNHISQEKLDEIHDSIAYKTLEAMHPKFRNYMKTLHDTSQHSNLEATVRYNQE